MALGLLELLLPRRCATCGLPGDHLCVRCAVEITPLDGPSCLRCGHPQPVEVARCPACRRVPPGSRQAVAWEGPAIDLVHDLKDRGVRAAAEPLARLLVLHTPPPDGVLVPVPASRSGRRDRGFDQAGLIANLAGKEWGCEVRTPLVRRAAGRQRGAPVRERLALGPGAFRVRPDSVAGGVVLVDDVVTTGSSLAAAAAALRAAGHTVVGTRAVARVLRPAGRR